MSLALNKHHDWHPTASLATLKQRAQLIQTIRTFFIDQSVLEVETPLLGQYPVTDPYIESIKTTSGWLQTSPEYAMKRLLAAYQTDIFQLCKAFRQEESGNQHHPEFTLLEWYRTGFDHHQLMNEVDVLLQQLLNMPTATKHSYQHIFEEILSINPLTSTVDELQQCAKKHHIEQPFSDPNRDDWLMLLFHHLIEPTFTATRATFIYDYPSTQAALAKINEYNPKTAARFEVYVGNIELANGFHELTDAATQKARFMQNNQRRTQQGASSMPIDDNLLSALQHGLPSCSGVALGIDRLLMVALSQSNINSVTSFPPCQDHSV